MSSPNDVIPKGTIIELIAIKGGANGAIVLVDGEERDLNPATLLLATTPVVAGKNIVNGNITDCESIHIGDQQKTSIGRK